MALTRSFRRTHRNHPRIVMICGVTTKEQEYFGLVLEDCSRGDLRNLLNQTATHLSNVKKLQLLTDIAEVIRRHASFFLAWLVLPLILACPCLFLSRRFNIRVWSIFMRMESSTEI